MHSLAQTYLQLNLTKLNLTCIDYCAQSVDRVAQFEWTNSLSSLLFSVECLIIIFCLFKRYVSLLYV